MRRIVSHTLAIALIAGLSGCSLFQKKQPQSESYAALEPYAPIEPAADRYQPDPYPTYAAPSTDYSAGSTAGSTYGSRYHTVVKSDTLFKLARQYYGDARRWKDIHEANRGEISNPDQIRVGQRLVIP